MNHIERLKYPLYVTNSSMVEIITQLTKEKQVGLICKENSLNLNLLKNLLKEKMRGYNNTVVAERLGVHRVTIQRYVETLRNLNDLDFDLIYDFLLKEKNETEN